MSVSLHMLADGGNPKGLFRGAIMQSGAPPPVGPIEDGQIYYNDLVERTKCEGPDTLKCLQNVDYGTLMKAVNQSPTYWSKQASRVEHSKERSLTGSNI